MILKDNYKQEQKYWKYGSYALLFVLSLGLIYFLLQWFIPLITPPMPNKVLCDAEATQGRFFLSSGNTFENGNTQTEEMAFSGNFSSKVDSSQTEGFSYKMRYPKAGERYKISVWRYKVSVDGGYLVVKAPDKDDFYKEESIATTRKDGWEKIEIVFNTPPKKLEYLKIFVTSKNNQTVYFDDLLIERLTVKNPVKKYNPPVVSLEIAEDWYEKLEKRRADALSTGVLMESDNQIWTEGRILQADVQIPLMLKLKGDWLDQLKENKWAFRLKVDNKYAWNKMQEFSFETPAVRNYLREWLFLRFLQKEGVIAPRYDFVELKINNIPSGIYAYEEHFDRALLTLNQRVDGPMLKFSDDAYWLNLKRDIENYGEERSNREFVNSFNVALIEPYRQTETTVDLERKKQFEIAKKLMNQYKYNLKPADEIFDIDIMAKFYAITDIMQAYHGLAWHNQRFYFNPTTSKLEPIGYDGFGARLKRWGNKPYIGYNIFNQKFDDEGLYVNLFLNEAFIKKYTYYLHQFTEEEYINDFILSIEGEIRQREAFIQREYASYSFDEDVIIDNARHIRSFLIPYNNVSLQAFEEGNEGKAKRVKLTNYHPIPLEVIGFGTNDVAVRDYLDDPKLLEINLIDQVPSFVMYKINDDLKYVFYKIHGTEKLYVSPILPWRESQKLTAEQQLFNGVTPVTNRYYTVVNNKIVFKKGNYEVSGNIVIPKGYKVFFEAGVKLNFTKGAGFVSKSPVIMQGTKQDKIIIRSSDRTGNGFTVLNAKDQSIVNKVVFEDLRGLQKGDWKLSGAVVFHQSPVIFTNCTFLNSHAENAITLTNTNFELHRNLITRSDGNGLVVNYSKGKISDLMTLKIEKDAIVLIGGEADIDDINLQTSGGKALHVSEGNKTKVKNAEINGARIGIVSRDLSFLKINFVNLKNCQEGFAAYQNKPEFGSSEIIVDKYKAQNIKYLHLIEAGSILNLENKLIKGS